VAHFFRVVKAVVWCLLVGLPTYANAQTWSCSASYSSYCRPEHTTPFQEYAYWSGLAPGSYALCATGSQPAYYLKSPDCSASQQLSSWYCSGPGLCPGQEPPPPPNGGHDTCNPARAAAGEAGSFYTARLPGDSVSGVMNNVCSGGCKLAATSNHTDQIGNEPAWNIKAKVTAEQCTTASQLRAVSVPPPAPEEIRCTPPLVLWNMGTAQVCGEPGPSNPYQTAVADTTTTTPPGGTATTTTTVRETTISGGNVTENQSVTVGGQTTVTTTTAAQSSFCRDNPDAPICRYGSFAGDCGQPLVCTGDPVQCQIAREVTRLRCEQVGTSQSNPVSTLGQQVLDGVDPSTASNDAAKRAQVDLPSSLDQSTFLGSACPADTQFTVAGRVLAIPWSSICPYLGMMGQVLVLVTLIISARLVTGA